MNGGDPGEAGIYNETGLLKSGLKVALRFWEAKNYGRWLLFTNYH